MSVLQVVHHSHKKYYREPFGAVPCGEQVILRLKVQSDAPVEECLLRLWVKEKEEKLLPMDLISQGEIVSGSELIFEAKVPLPLEPGLVWYYFRLAVEGKTYFYLNNPEGLGGEGVLSIREGSSFQITVYKPSPVPEWFKKGILYQIFVDRFFNGNPGGEIFNPKKGSLLHGNWEDTPFYIKDEKGRILRWTFFGGNLQGVRKKLPYLQELGITTIYFNPIFEAASNHKYDTGDYFKIDSMFGDLNTFAELILEGEKRGISVILDGVFSHTGSDSIYFNKYGNYPGLGAFQSEESPYFSWYHLQECQQEDYECWWGVQDLPNVKELEPSYREFIYKGEKSVIRFWLSKGVKGWRLDVADELPDEFIQELRQAVKETDSQAVLIGEVWEDASHKISYGKMREYFWGDELDSAMNYPLREILLAYILEKDQAREACRRIMSLYENYPPENFRAAMNLLGSHDRIRILTILGEGPAEESLTLEEREKYRLPPEARNKAIRRLKLLVLLQMTLPGVPCVYYGDEAGVEGFSDPYNRGTFPWGKEDQDLQEWYRKLIRLRKEYNVFLEGEFFPFSAGSEVLGFRTKRKEEEIVVCINRNRSQDAQVEIEIEKGGINLLALELLSGQNISKEALRKEPLEHEKSVNFEILLKPLEGKALYFADRNQRGNKKKELERSCGILLHLTSLPSSWGIGDMGKEAEKFVDFLADFGQELWQVLPLNPTGLGFSPYQGPSVFAGNSLLISLEKLQEEGLLRLEDVENAEDVIDKPAKHSADLSKAEYFLAEKRKNLLLRKAFLGFQSGLERKKSGSITKSEYLSYDNYQDFLKRNKFWLEDYCLFLVLKEQSGGLPWHEWERPLAFREAGALERLRAEWKEEISYHRFVQYTFFFQWQCLKKYAGNRGVKIIGDLPIYVAGDSCDTWVNRELFTLDATGRPSTVAGVPPDYFSETGQRWGNPLYNWTKMEETGFRWWKQRVKQVLENYDVVRLDHFRAFEAFWEIEAEADTAAKGRWLKGPGKKFFEELGQEFGELPFIAEDLGWITPEVHNLKNILGFPGMRVYQFEEHSPDEDNLESYPKKKKIADMENVKNVEDMENMENIVYYSGTHDNDTLLGWYGEQNEEILNRILEKIYQSHAAWVIIPFQDILGLGSEARMNTPGTVQGNWEWRMKEDDLTENRKEWLKAMAIRSGRMTLERKNGK